VVSRVFVFTEEKDRRECWWGEGAAMIMVARRGTIVTRECFIAIFLPFSRADDAAHA
jgi:hypothetical protein